MKKRRKNADPYNSAAKPDPWGSVPVKKDRTRRTNAQRACVIYARRGRGPLMFFDGKKLTNNGKPKYYGTQGRARGAALTLIRKYPVLRSFKVFIGPPQRRANPESREAGLDTAAQRLEEFSGHPARKVIKVSARSHAREGLVFGELDQIGYRTKRDGINGGKLTRYTHAFSSGSRPLLAVTKDGKQLHIVGGRYEFTDAGIEDR